MLDGVGKYLQSLFPLCVLALIESEEDDRICANSQTSAFRVFGGRGININNNIISNFHLFIHSEYVACTTTLSAAAAATTTTTNICTIKCMNTYSHTSISVTYCGRLCYRARARVNAFAIRYSHTISAQLCLIQFR